MSTHSALRYEAALKVTGSAVYEAEVPAAGLLHAALVEAPISCGDVLSVDAMQAINLPGFAAMVSHADAEVLQASAATASPEASTSTRISGSVPDARTSTRPSSPSSSLTRSIAWRRAGLSSFVATRMFALRWTKRGIAAASSLRGRPRKAAQSSSAAARPSPATWSRR